MSQMTPEVSKLLERALSLSLEEQEALADSLISSLGGKLDEGLIAAWDAEIARRIEELNSGTVKTIFWGKNAKAQFSKTTACPLNQLNFMTRLAPNMTTPSTGIWSAVMTPLSTSTLKSTICQEAIHSSPGYKSSLC